MEQNTLIPVCTAMVGAVVSVVTASITSKTQVAIAQINAGTKPGDAGPKPRDTGNPQYATESLKRQRTVSLAALACGVVLLGWGIYSYFEIRTLNLLIQAKEQKFEQLRQSFSKAAGITFNPIDVKATFKADEDEDTRDCSLWIEAEDAILDDIDHVKYVFNDPTWTADSVLTGDKRDSEGGKHFELALASPEALTYITVLVLYKGYKDNGKIQPINFRWQDEEKENE